MRHPNGREPLSLGPDLLRGTGLGLALVKKLVDVNNSMISVTSKEEEGSSFKITIPIKDLKTQEK